MGLCIHYQLAGPRGCDAASALRLVEALHGRLAVLCESGALSAVWEMSESAAALESVPEWIHWVPPGGLETTDCSTVLPLEGCVFRVRIGEGCESMVLGLCRYPASIEVNGVLQATRLRGWRLAAAVKTQYASNHGWEHFRRCHLTVLDVLSVARELGFGVRIQDDGGYWPRRSERNLRRNIDRLNRLVAAVTGAIKDLAEEGSMTTYAPILAHPQFERLEAEGQAEILPEVRRVLSQLKPPSNS